MFHFLKTCLVIIVIGLPMVCFGQEQLDANWPSFRGQRAQGVSEGHATPVEWSVEDSKNIRWKTPIPGLAHSSPGSPVCHHGGQ